MPTLMKVKVGLAAGMFVVIAGCGKHSPNVLIDMQRDGSYFITRELTKEEIKEKNYDSQPEMLRDSSLPFDARTLPLEHPAELFNTLAGVIQKVIKEGETKKLSAVLIGHALPPNVEPIQLTQGNESSQIYEKKLVSLLGADLICVEYKISFQHGAKYTGSGAYVTNVKFTPLKVNTDPLWTLVAEALSEKPVNTGTQKNPIAKLSLSITFTAKGVGTRSTTDEFTLDGQKGLLKAEIRNFGK